MQLKTTLRYHVTSTKKVIKTDVMMSVAQDAEKLKPSYTAGQSLLMVHYFGKVSQKAKHSVTI